MVSQISATPWLGTLGGGGAATPGLQPNLAYALTPDPETIAWAVDSNRSFAVSAPADAVIRTDIQTVASVVIATTEAGLDCAVPVYQLDVSDGDVIWMGPCTEGAGRIEIRETATATPFRIYQFIVGPLALGGYGSGYSRGYG